ncbi:MAG: PAS domain S-box protein [Desulfobacteraceae bacterium]|nr:PAS domain S-box protein [Desulfobacteraceae bacterium]MCF8095019.1 PAS domain S-box protein [Desulfobacteraceae bacterium]
MKKKHISLYVSPWMIIGAALILLAILMTMAVNNYNREKRYMAQILLEKGAALIKSFEAGTRTGMRAMGWNERQVQYLIEELADQADVVYIAVTDISGRILAHSDSGQVGGVFANGFDESKPDPAQSPKWRLTSTQNSKPAFEVYRFFNPFTKGNGHINHTGRMSMSHMGRMRQNSPRRDATENNGAWCMPGNYEKNEQIIFIGFDRTPFIEARQQDFRNTAIISSVLMVLGFAGFTTMLVAQSYRATRRRLQDTSAIADEVVAGLPAGLMVMDQKGNIVLANPAAESITGLEAEAIRGEPARDVLPENLARLISGAGPETRIIEEELECSFAGEKAVPLSVSSAGIVNEDGVFIGSLIIFRDLTEIKALQQAMQRKEKLAAVGGLAAGIAHEIRNPLSSVKGMATYFKNKFTDDPEARQAAELMVQETDRLNRVINELLEFARPSKINSRPTDINTVIDHSVRLIRQDVEDRNIGLRLYKGENLPATDIDPDRFVQCLLNLYLNSIQAMEGGGQVIAETGFSEEGGIVIRIEDNGPGISEKDISRIFDPYFTTKSKGTGLGLAIVHKIVEDHGGEITVKSTPGQGTEFTIHLPASRQQTEKEA